MVLTSDIRRGVDNWNAWRRKERLTKPDLSDAKLSRADLSGAQLWWSNLSGANLAGADLNGADLTRSTLIGTDFTALISPVVTSMAYARGV